MTIPLLPLPKACIAGGFLGVEHSDVSDIYREEPSGQWFPVSLIFPPPGVNEVCLVGETQLEVQNLDTT